MHLRDLQIESWKVAEEKGHHDTWRKLPEREACLALLALVHTEVSEAVQEIKRRGVTYESLDVIGLELADVLIRIGDFAEEYGVNLEESVALKMTQNQTRPYKYGTPEEVPTNASPS